MKRKHRYDRGAGDPLRELRTLNDTYQMLLSRLSETRETQEPGCIEEIRLLRQIADICEKLSGKTEGAEKDHWIERMERWEKELPPIDFSEKRCAQKNGLSAPDRLSTTVFYGMKNAASVNVLTLAYKFKNSREELYPGNPCPKFPLIRYQQVFGKNAIAWMLFKRTRKWGGSCFGMSASSMLFSQHVPGLTADDFLPGAMIPYDLSISSRNEKIQMSLLEYIEALHITQFSQIVSRESQRVPQDPNLLDNLWEKVKHFQETGKDPIILGVFKCGFGGHEILPYGTEVTDDRTAVILTYDCNFGTMPHPLYLTQDSTGHFNGWKFDLYGDDNPDTLFSNEKDDIIDYNTFDIIHKAWKERGDLEIRNSASAMTLSKDCTVMDEHGSVMLSIKGSSAKAFRDSVTIVNEKSASPSSERLVWLPTGRYTIRNDSTDRSLMTVSLADENQCASIQTDAGNIQVYVDDSIGLVHIKLTEEARKYRIELYSTLPDTHEDIVLEGRTSAEGVSLAQYRGEIYATGLESATTWQLLVDGLVALLSDLILQDVEDVLTDETANVDELSEILIQKGSEEKAPQDNAPKDEDPRDEDPKP